MGSLDKQGSPMLTTRELAEKLAIESGFEYQDESLSEVYAASKKIMGPNNLFQFLEQHFRYCIPSNEYNILARFPWVRIYTTNIDDAFENAIARSTMDSPQRIRIQTRKKPLVDRDQTYSFVDLVKLHGSVDRLEEGVIFSSTEYGLEAATPSPWYSQIGYDYQNYSFVIIGSTLNEPVLYQQVQYAHQKIQNTSPQSYLVVPYISQLQKKAFTESNIIHIPWKLEDFAHWMEDKFSDTAVPRNWRIGIITYYFTYPSCPRGAVIDLNHVRHFKHAFSLMTKGVEHVFGPTRFFASNGSSTPAYVPPVRSPVSRQPLRQVIHLC